MRNRRGVEPGGKHDFLPGDEAIVHGTGGTPITGERYCSEKIAELVLTQGQLAKALAERDALEGGVADLLNRTKNFGHSGFPSMAHFEAFADAHIEAKAILSKLEGGELGKPVP